MCVGRFGSFAGLGLKDDLCDLQMCQMCIGIKLFLKMCGGKNKNIEA